MRVLIVAVVLIAGACASTGERSTRDRNVLTLEEIQQSPQSDALGLIRGLRPQWLRVRGASTVSADNPIMVYLDGTRLGGPDVLSSIQANTIEEIRYYGPSEAQTRFGLNNTNGAIAIRTRRG